MIMNKNIARQLIKHFDKNASLVMVDKDKWIVEFEVQEKGKYYFQWYSIKIIDLLKLLIDNRFNLKLINKIWKNKI